MSTSAVTALPANEFSTVEVPAIVSSWLKAVKWAAFALLACILYGAIEKYLFGWPGAFRLCRHPDSLMVQAIGFPHFWIAIFFVLSSRRVKSKQGVFWLFGTLVIGFALLWLFIKFGGSQNPVLYLLVFFYFLIHDFRDQAFFFQSSATLPAETAQARKNVISALQFMLLALLFAFLVPTYLQYLEIRGQLPADSRVLEFFFPASWPFLTRFAMYLIPVLLLDAVLCYALHRRFPGGWREIWRQCQPLLAVFAGYTLIVLSTLVIGAGTLSFIILIHVLGWYFFACKKLAAAERQNPASSVSWRRPLRWFRTSISGFRTLHIGLAVLIIGLHALSAYGFGKTDWTAHLLGQEMFTYWTIIHITTSFVPR